MRTNRLPMSRAERDALRDMLRAGLRNGELRLATRRGSRTLGPLRYNARPAVGHQSWSGK